MSNPKFSIGDAVMVRCVWRPDVNRDYTIIESFEIVPPSARCSSQWVGYRTSRTGGYVIAENHLHPIPKEDPNGIDIHDFIKDPLKYREGVEA